jgi:tripartite-type tricarboxylate transporter receptor subunit TctC
MHLTRRTVALALGCLAAGVGRAAAAPPIRIVWPYPAGGAGDATARLIAEVLQAALDRPVLVESKPGAAGRLGVQAVREAAADGSTLLLVPIAPMAIFPHSYDKLGYDPAGDFAPISQVASFDIGVAVGAQADVASLQELVAWLGRNPARAAYGTPAAGSLPHFFAVQFGRTTGLDLNHVAYRGSPQGLADLMGGHLPVFFTSSQEMVEAHKAGRIRVLATSGARRSPALPEVPTFTEAGHAIRGEGWYGLYAPAKTPHEIVRRLNAAVVEAMKTEDIRRRLTALGLQPTGTSPAELARIQAADTAFWAPVIKASGFRSE